VLLYLRVVEVKFRYLYVSASVSLYFPLKLDSVGFKMQLFGYHNGKHGKHDSPRKDK